MNQVLSIWVELLVSLLLVVSGIFTLLAAWGMIRLKTFFQRMHPPALISTAASWSVTLASVVYFSAVTEALALTTWLIIIVLSITAPITTLMLARAALFRKRQADEPGLPPPLQPHSDELPR